MVRAIFDNAGFVVPGEDVKVAGVKVGKVDSLDVTPEFKAAVVLRIDDPGYRDFRRDASCIIRPQSLIGEKFVECEPTQKRAVGTEPPPSLRKLDRGPGEGQYFLPVAEHRAGGRPRPDQQHAAAALPRAPVADPQRARRDRRRPRRGRARRDPPREPGAEGDRPRAGDPRLAEQGAPGPRAQRRHDHGAAGARAPPRLGRARQLGRGGAGHGRAPRRASSRTSRSCPSSCASCARR